MGRSELTSNLDVVGGAPGFTVACRSLLRKQTWTWVVEGQDLP